MTRPIVLSVVFLRIHAVHLAHADGEIGVRCFDHQMVVIIHEAEGMAKPIVPSDNGSEDGKENLSILIIAENLVPRVPARSDMIDGSRIFDSQWSRHKTTLSENYLHFKT
jgi:hypothetical protein